MEDLERVMSRDDLEKIIDKAHRRIDYLERTQAVLEHRIQQIERDVSPLQASVSKLLEEIAGIKAMLAEMRRNSPNPWSIVVAVAGWAVALLLAVIQFVLRGGG